MSTETRTFHIGDILSFTDGKLVAPGGMAAVQQLAEWMVGAPVWTHQLPRVADEVAPALREQHPDLAAVVVPDLDGEAEYLAWLDEQVTVHGLTRQVAPLRAVDHTSIHPVAEMLMLRPDAPVITVGIDPPTP